MEDDSFSLIHSAFLHKVKIYFPEFGFRKMIKTKEVNK
jgi:hypothetical protein